MTFLFAFKFGTLLQSLVLEHEIKVRLIYSAQITKNQFTFTEINTCVNAFYYKFSDDLASQYQARLALQSTEVWNKQ